ncbi:MAG: type II toxin-antitoxin system mRNA interferase toxin, RelE/StbE family, partial [Nitrospirae bacterium]|nr:type II toxin-antitoxin system mRNA interferase toxin, RelE/StbE family [Nitrospirota bacterium]
MAYNVVYKKSVSRDLKKLPKAETERILDQIEDELSKKPEAYPVLKGQFAGLRKYRVGDYRAIYAIFEYDVLIL